MGLYLVSYILELLFRFFGSSSPFASTVSNVIIITVLFALNGSILLE